MWGQLSTTCSNVLKQPNGKITVAVNHNKLRTMASETVDPIDWSHPPRSWAVPPECHLHSKRADIERELASRADQRELRWFRHEVRMDGYRMATPVLIANVSGGVDRG